jgi:preprotein translocase subunit SecG
MTIVFVILIILAAVVLGFIVLVQNPKGGGLAGSMAGFSNQFMGVKQTTDVLEKGTWIFAGVIALLCLLSVMFIGKTGAASNNGVDGKGLPIPASTQQQAPPPGTTTPANTVPATQPPATNPATPK